MPPDMGATTMATPRNQACILCKQRHVRCDKTKPCSNCVKADVECRVVPSQPPRRQSINTSEEDHIERLRTYEALVSQKAPRKDELRAALVRQWQMDTHPEVTETNQSPLAAHRYELIVQLYKPALKLLHSEADRNDDTKILKRALETLLLWGQQYGVSTGELDRMIDRSWRLRRSVLKSLTRVGGILTDRLLPRFRQPLPQTLQQTVSLLHRASEEANFFLKDSSQAKPEDPTSSDNDSDVSSVFEDDSLSEIAEDLKCNVDSLLDLDALYDYAKENVIFRDEELPEEFILDALPAPSTAAKIYTDMIRMRYPKANYDLLTYLGQANYNRFIKGVETRRRNEKHAGKSEAEEPLGTVAGESKFIDSGVGTSLHTSNYAETIMSFYHRDGNVVRVPSLPELGRKGLPFTCFCCGKTVRIASNKAWKRHLFQDLEPYNCLEDSCYHNTSPLASREKWVTHLRSHYGDECVWSSFDCALCLEEIGPGEPGIVIHLEKHLQDIALAALPKNGDADSDTDGESTACSFEDPTKDENGIIATPEATRQPAFLRQRSMSYLSKVNAIENVIRQPYPEQPDNKLTVMAKHILQQRGIAMPEAIHRQDQSQEQSHTSIEQASITRVFQCPNCPAVFKSSIDLDTHSLTHREASSYWSVTEAEAFPHLLRTYGSDWAAIAEHIGTKTAVMVKNYYNRKKYINTWVSIVQDADASRTKSEMRGTSDLEQLPSHYCISCGTATDGTLYCSGICRLRDQVQGLGSIQNRPGDKEQQSALESREDSSRSKGSRESVDVQSWPAPFQPWRRKAKRERLHNGRTRDERQGMNRYRNDGSVWGDSPPTDTTAKRKKTRSDSVNSLSSLPSIPAESAAKANTEAIENEAETKESAAQEAAEDAEWKKRVIEEARLEDQFRARKRIEDEKNAADDPSKFSQWGISLWGQEMKHHARMKNKEGADNDAGTAIQGGSWLYSRDGEARADEWRKTFELEAKLKTEIEVRIIIEDEYKVAEDAAKAAEEKSNEDLLFKKQVLEEARIKAEQAVGP
ncbi:hypothetical protein GGR57DRAFT_476225 [Xylariaceae sp. FL1272]|nr:hypothetical protein GGR57DRAFT_476225 [Xylariaceae sp. FL1272]